MGHLTPLSLNIYGTSAMFHAVCPAQEMKVEEVQLGTTGW